MDTLFLAVACGAIVALLFSTLVLWADSRRLAAYVKAVSEIERQIRCGELRKLDFDF